MKNPSMSMQNKEKLVILLLPAVAWHQFRSAQPAVLEEQEQNVQTPPRETVRQASGNQGV
jgi:hypothetical protein